MKYSNSEKDNGHDNDFLHEQPSKNNVVTGKNKKNTKNFERPFIVMNQKPENQRIFAKKSRVPGVKPYNESLGDGSNKEGRNIEIFCSNIPKGIRIKESNQHINNGNVRLCRFLGTTSRLLLHYLDVNLDNTFL